MGNQKRYTDCKIAMKKDTKLIHAGREKKYTGKAVSPPVYHASTIIHDTVQELNESIKNIPNNSMFYGRRGTPTHFAFRKAMVELEGGYGALVYPSGLAAINAALMTFLSSGDHLLMVDTVYGPTRTLCDTVLTRMGIEITYYDPHCGASISNLFKKNTKAVFTESPGSVTMEIQDIPSIANAAHENNIMVMIDNTYGNLVNFDPYAHGVDLSIQAATKYIVGHSDAMLGTVTCGEKYWKKLFHQSYAMGYTAGPDDVDRAMRGIRTIRTRIKQHEQSALKIAGWLKKQNLVDMVLHPAFSDCPGHEIWKRDFSGSNGLFSFTMTEGNDDAITAMMDSFTLFKMGFSWGGFESLAMSFYDLKSEREFDHWNDYGPLVRLHVGLEDVDDLIADLEQGLDHYKKAL